MTKYAAYDDSSIYAIGNSPEDAIQTARDDARDQDAEFLTANISDEFAAEIERDGFDGKSEAFGFDRNGYLERAERCVRE